MSTTSYPVFRAIAQHPALFEATAAVRGFEWTAGRGADARAVDVVAASAQYFAVLGARPARGRFFTETDDALPAGTPVVVLSHAYWKRQYAGNPAVLGKEIVLNDEAYTIVGVAPPGFSGDGLAKVDAFVPLTTALRGHSDGWWSDAAINLVSVITRRRADVPAARAEQVIGALVRDARAGREDVDAITLAPLLSPVTRENTQARISFWLLGVSFVVLAIATANVGTLLLLRALRRRRDVAIRMALGAGRGRLASQLTLESVLLALAGGAAGLLVSQWLSELVRATLLPDLAPSDRFIDPLVLTVTLVLALVSGLVAGLAPLALIASRHLAAELYGLGILSTVSRSRAQRLLVGVQVALCTLLIVGAGLFVRSLQRVQSQDLGFSTSRLLVAELDFRDPLSGREQDEAHYAAVRGLERLPGVSRVSVAAAMPFGSFNVPPISVPGLSEPPSAEGQLPFLYASTPAYLEMLGVRLVRGRMFTEGDRAGSPYVVLVNETFAREVWPNQDALGKCIRAGFDPNLPPQPLAPATLPCREVVGIVRDTRARSLRPVGREASLMQYYVPFEQAPLPPFPGARRVFSILVRVNGDAGQMAPVVQRFIQGASTTRVFAHVQQYQDLLNPQMRPWRLGATLFSAFGALALAIAAVGLFGVMSYIVTQRTREIGLRMALGGTRSSIWSGVVGSAVKMVALGVLAGIAVALATAPRAQDLLFQTSARDAVVFAGAALALLLVSALAAAIPAWRAAAVSPMTALRSD